MVQEDLIPGQNRETMGLMLAYGSSLTTMHSDSNLIGVSFSDEDEDGCHDLDWMGFLDEVKITDELYATNAPIPLPSGDLSLSHPNANLNPPRKKLQKKMMNPSLTSKPYFA